MSQVMQACGCGFNRLSHCSHCKQEGTELSPTLAAAAEEKLRRAIDLHPNDSDAWWEYINCMDVSCMNSDRQIDR